MTFGPGEEGSRPNCLCMSMSHVEFASGEGRWDAHNGDCGRGKLSAPVFRGAAKVNELQTALHKGHKLFDCACFVCDCLVWKSIDLPPIRMIPDWQFFRAFAPKMNRTRHLRMGCILLHQQGSRHQQ